MMCTPNYDEQMLLLWRDWEKRKGRNITFMATCIPIGTACIHPFTISCFGTSLIFAKTYFKAFSISKANLVQFINVAIEVEHSIDFTKQWFYTTLILHNIYFTPLKFIGLSLCNECYQLQIFQSKPNFRSTRSEHDKNGSTGIFCPFFGSR